MTIKSQVERLMLIDQRTKECDNWLVLSFLREIGVNIDLNYAQAKALPSFELITRTRRKLQETKEEALQSSPRVQEKRSKAENKFKKKYRRQDYSDSGIMKNSDLIW